MELTLTAAERVRLRATMKQTASARLYRRLQAVFLAGEGHSATQIAAITGASARSVQYWCSAWRYSKEHRHPQKALAEKPRLGRHPGLPELNRARLLGELAQDPLALGYAATNWTVPLLAAHLRRQGWPVSPRTLHRRLHAAGLRWKRCDLSLIKWTRGSATSRKHNRHEHHTKQVRQEIRRPAKVFSAAMLGR